jgi:hypothetical protein
MRGPSHRLQALTFLAGFWFLLFQSLCGNPPVPTVYEGNDERPPIIVSNGG